MEEVMKDKVLRLAKELEREFEGIVFEVVDKIINGEMEVNKNFEYVEEYDELNEAMEIVQGVMYDYCNGLEGYKDWNEEFGSKEIVVALSVEGKHVTLEITIEK